MSASATPQPTVSTWNIDPVHSVAEFKVRHMMIANAKGRFTGIKGVLALDEADVTNSRVEATIQASSINTSDSERDTHLKSPDFLDVVSFPTLSFKSTRISRAANGELTVAGDLTVHGVTRPVVFDVEGPTAPAKDPWGNSRVGVSATTKISRKEFGLTWNAALETGGIILGDEVAISLDVEFVKA